MSFVNFACLKRNQIKACKVKCGLPQQRLNLVSSHKKRLCPLFTFFIFFLVDWFTNCKYTRNIFKSKEHNTTIVASRLCRRNFQGWSLTIYLFNLVNFIARWTIICAVTDPIIREIIWNHGVTISVSKFKISLYFVSFSWL